MARIRRLFARPRAISFAMFAVIVLLAPLQFGVVATRARDGVPPQAAPSSLPPAPTVPAVESAPPSPDPSPSPTPSKRAKPKATKPKPARTGPDVSMFRGLGAWIDLWDYSSLDPVETVALAKRHGVRTLYIQTGRFNTDVAVSHEVGPWLVAGHRAGMDVVGWYLPAYADMDKEFRRSMAIAEYRYQGHAFDAVGIDIEWKNDVRNPEWNHRVARNLEQVHRALRGKIALTAIVPPPLQMTVAPRRWAGFPWAEIGRHSDVVMLMSYWSYRDCENIPEHCAYEFTVLNLEETRRLIRNAKLPIHTIGGVGDRITKGELRDFVRGAIDGRAFGASLYDVRTTRAAYWPVLSALRRL